MDLSDNVSLTQTADDRSLETVEDGTETHSKMENSAIVEEETSQTTETDLRKETREFQIPTPEGHHRPTYNDFLERQQT